MTPTTPSDKSRIGYRLATLGVLWLFATIATEVVLHILGLPELPRHVVYGSFTAAAIVGYWGFYWALPKRAKGGLDSVLTARERLMRLGRRDSDRVAVVVDEPVGPVAEDRHPVTPETPVTVPQSVLNPPTEASD